MEEVLINLQVIIAEALISLQVIMEEALINHQAIMEEAHTSHKAPMDGVVINLKAAMDGVPINLTVPMIKVTITLEAALKVPIHIHITVPMIKVITINLKALMDGVLTQAAILEVLTLKYHLGLHKCLHSLASLVPMMISQISKMLSQDSVHSSKHFLNKAKIKKMLLMMKMTSELILMMKTMKTKIMKTLS
jgi:hypothetical protein